MFANLANNAVKKALCIVLSVVLFTIGAIALLYTYGTLAGQIVASLTGLVPGSLLLIVLFHSFFKPIYLFKNKVVRIVFPLVFNWGGFIVFIALHRTEAAALIALLMAFTGYIFSGILSEMEYPKPLFFLNAAVNWMFSRFFLAIFFFINLANLLKRIYESGYIEFYL